jgi:PhnB protein
VQQQHRRRTCRTGLVADEHVTSVGHAYQRAQREERWNRLAAASVGAPGAPPELTRFTSQLHSHRLSVQFGSVAPADETVGTSILPQLSVRHGRAAIEFYKAAFGATEVYRVGGTDEAPDVVAQLSVGNASFWVSDESPPNANFSPESVGGGTVRLLLIVDDPDAAVEGAKAAGASEVYPVGEAHGWRLGRIEDPFGHHWEIGKPLIPWPPS